MRKQNTYVDLFRFGLVVSAAFIAFNCLVFSGVAQYSRAIEISSSSVIKLCSKRSETKDSILITITNTGAENISSLRISSYADSSLSGFYSWSGNISSQQNEKIKIPVNLNPLSDTSFIILVTDKLNGSDQFEKDTIQLRIESGTGLELNLPKFQYFCLGQPTTLNAGKGYKQYQWGNGDTSDVLVVNNPGSYDITVVDEYGCTHKDTIQARHHNYPYSILPSSLELCENEQKTLSVDPKFTLVDWSSGGSANSIIIESSGLYQVTVTDTNGCRYTSTTHVQELTSPVSILNNIETSCSNESLELFAGDYETVVWNGVDSTLKYTPNKSGVYSVEITGENGCITKDSVQVEIYPSPIVSISGDSVLCNNGVVILETDGSEGDYSWNTLNSSGNKLDVREPGVYQVQVVDENGCIGKDEFAVTQEFVSLVSTSSDTILCNGDAIKLTAETEDDNSILWPNGTSGNEFQISSSGDYVVKALSAHCEVEDIISIEQRFAPSSEFDISIVDNQISLSHLGKYGDSFEWDFGDNNTSTIENPSHIYTNIGDFDVTLTTQNVCGISTDKITVHIGSLGINELENKGFISIYPNPVKSESFNVNFSNWSGEVSFGLYDNSGRLVFEKETTISGSSSLQIPVSKLARGMYLFVASMPNQHVIEKILID